MTAQGQKRTFQKGAIDLLILAFVAIISLAIPFTAKLVQQNQEVRKQAAVDSGGGGCATCEVYVSKTCYKDVQQCDTCNDTCYDTCYETCPSCLNYNYSSNECDEWGTADCNPYDCNPHDCNPHDCNCTTVQEPYECGACEHDSSPACNPCGSGDCNTAGLNCEQDGGKCEGSKPNCTCNYSPEPTATPIPTQPEGLSGCSNPSGSLSQKRCEGSSLYECNQAGSSYLWELSTNCPYGCANNACNVCSSDEWSDYQIGSCQCSGSTGEKEVQQKNRCGESRFVNTDCSNECLAPTSAPTSTPTPQLPLQLPAAGDAPPSATTPAPSAPAAPPAEEQDPCILHIGNPVDYDNCQRAILIGGSEGDKNQYVEVDAQGRVTAIKWNTFTAADVNAQNAKKGLEQVLKDTGVCSTFLGADKTNCETAVAIGMTEGSWQKYIKYEGGLPTGILWTNLAGRMPDFKNENTTTKEKLQELVNLIGNNSSLILALEGTKNVLINKYIEEETTKLVANIPSQVDSQKDLNINKCMSDCRKTGDSYEECYQFCHGYYTRVECDDVSKTYNLVVLDQSTNAILSVQDTKVSCDGSQSSQTVFSDRQCEGDDLQIIIDGKVVDSQPCEGGCSPVINDCVEPQILISKEYIFACPAGLESVEQNGQKFCKRDTSEVSCPEGWEKTTKEGKIVCAKEFEVGNIYSAMGEAVKQIEYTDPIAKYGIGENELIEASLLDPNVPFAEKYLTAKTPAERALVWKFNENFDANGEMKIDPRNNYAPIDQFLSGCEGNGLLIISGLCQIANGRNWAASQKAADELFPKLYTQKDENGNLISLTSDNPIWQQAKLDPFTSRLLMMKGLDYGMTAKVNDQAVLTGTNWATAALLKTALVGSSIVNFNDATAWTSYVEGNIELDRQGAGAGDLQRFSYSVAPAIDVLTNIFPVGKAAKIFTPLAERFAVTRGINAFGSGVKKGIAGGVKGLLKRETVSSVADLSIDKTFNQIPPAIVDKALPQAPVINQVIPAVPVRPNVFDRITNSVREAADYFRLPDLGAGVGVVDEELAQVSIRAAKTAQKKAELEKVALGLEDQLARANNLKIKAADELAAVTQKATLNPEDAVLALQKQLADAKLVALKNNLDTLEITVNLGKKTVELELAKKEGNKTLISGLEAEVKSQQSQLRSSLGYARSLEILQGQLNSQILGQTEKTMLAGTHGGVNLFRQLSETTQKVTTSTKLGLFDRFGNKELKPAMEAYMAGNYDEAFKLAEDLYKKVDPKFTGFEFIKQKPGLGGTGNLLSDNLTISGRASLAIHETSHAVDSAYKRAGLDILSGKNVTVNHNYGWYIQSIMSTENKAYLAQYAMGAQNLGQIAINWQASIKQWTTIPDAFKALVFERYDWQYNLGKNLQNLPNLLAKPLPEAEKLAQLRGVQKPAGVVNKAEKQLEESLVKTYNESLKLNSPIIGEFSPEAELARISKLHGSDGLAELEAYKVKLAAQKNALAKTRTFIEETLLIDPDTPKEKLMKWVDQFGSQYGFTAQQKKSAETVIDAYVGNRQRMLKLRQDFPDDLALIKELRGVDLPKGTRVRVTVGPVAINIEADSLIVKGLYDKNMDIVVFPLSQKAKQTQAFATVSHGSGGSIQYNVYPFGNAEALTHEEQHMVNRFFKDIDWGHQLDAKARDEELFHLTDSIKWADDTAGQESLIRRYFTVRKEVYESSAKDEVLAMLRTGADIDDEGSYLFAKGPDEIYDYAYDIRNLYVRNKGGYYSDYVSKTAQLILEEEYDQDIRAAWNSFKRLEIMPGFSREQAIALLTSEDLAKWPKVVGRIEEGLSPIQKAQFNINFDVRSFYAKSGAKDLVDAYIYIGRILPSLPSTVADKLPGILASGPNLLKKTQVNIGKGIQKVPSNIKNGIDNFIAEQTAAGRLGEAARLRMERGRTFVSEEVSVQRLLKGEEIPVYHYLRVISPSDSDTALKNMKAGNYQNHLIPEGISAEGKTYQPLYFSVAPPQSPTYNSLRTSIKNLKIFDNRGQRSVSFQSLIDGTFNGTKYDGVLSDNWSMFINGNLELVIFDGQKQATNLQQLINIAPSQNFLQRAQAGFTRSIGGIRDAGTNLRTRVDDFVAGRKIVGDTVPPDRFMLIKNKYGDEYRIPENEIVYVASEIKGNQALSGGSTPVRVSYLKEAIDQDLRFLKRQQRGSSYGNNAIATMEISFKGGKISFNPFDSSAIPKVSPSSRSAFIGKGTEVFGNERGSVQLGLISGADLLNDLKNVPDLLPGGKGIIRAGTEILPEVKTFWRGLRDEFGRWQWPWGQSEYFKSSQLFDQPVSMKIYRADKNVVEVATYTSDKVGLLDELPPHTLVTTYDDIFAKNVDGKWEPSDQFLYLHNVDLQVNQTAIERRLEILKAKKWPIPFFHGTPDKLAKSILSSKQHYMQTASFTDSLGYASGYSDEDSFTALIYNLPPSDMVGFKGMGANKFLPVGTNLPYMKKTADGKIYMDLNYVFDYPDSFELRAYLESMGIKYDIRDGQIKVPLYRGLSSNNPVNEEVTIWPRNWDDDLKINKNIISFKDGVEIEVMDSKSPIIVPEN